MWRLALLACASCSLVPVSASANGKPIGPAASRSPAPAGVTPTVPDDDSPIYMAVPKAPVDPWAGVSGDAPLTYKDTVVGTRWKPGKDKATCTALRDHCLPAITWMAIRHTDLDSAIKTAHVVAFTAEGPVQPGVKRHMGSLGTYEPAESTGRSFAAYRTVPATKKNLVVGALVVAHADPFPQDAASALDQWTMGVIERVDWDLGFVFFAGSEQARFITATRVAVLHYTPGSKVTILGGKKRDELAVKAADVILPDP